MRLTAITDGSAHVPPRSMLCTALALMARPVHGRANEVLPRLRPLLPVPVSLPDLSRADEAVQVQARERHAVLLEKIEGGREGRELGAAYGELGMLLQAAEYFDAAEPCYLNAQSVDAR